MHREKEREEGARGAGIQIRSIMLPLIPLRPRFVRFSVLTGRAFILLSNERGTLGAPGRETDASNSSDRSARDPRAVGIKWKKSNRAQRCRRVAAFHSVLRLSVSSSVFYIERDSFRGNPARRPGRPAFHGLVCQELYGGM